MVMRMRRTGRGGGGLKKKKSKMQTAVSPNRGDWKKVKGRTGRFSRKKLREKGGSEINPRQHSSGKKEYDHASSYYGINNRRMLHRARRKKLRKRCSIAEAP